MRLSEEFSRIGYFCQEQDITIQELVDHIGYRSQALITLIFSIPFLLWIPLFGISTIFGLFILFNGYRIAMRKGFWMPKFMLKRKISGDHLAKWFFVGQSVLVRVEKLIRPRGKFLINHPSLLYLNGWILAICGFFLLLPLPPGAGFPPGLTTTFISIGILEEDGLFVVLGYIAFAFTCAVYGYFAMLGIVKLHHML